jgi:hypothetical protein
VQWFFFVLIALIAINHTLMESGADIPILSSASLHGVCPFGGVETLYTFATSGLLVRKIHDSALVLAGIVLLLSILFGPVFCGWVCPLGTVQEWVGKIGKKLFRRRYNHFVPARLDNLLRYARYGILATVRHCNQRHIDLRSLRPVLCPVQLLEHGSGMECSRDSWCDSCALGLRGTSLVQICLSVWGSSRAHKSVSCFFH